jgi:hypothetical protein
MHLQKFTARRSSKAMIPTLSRAGTTRWTSGRLLEEWNSKHQTYSARYFHFLRCRHPSQFGLSPFIVRLREGPRSRVIHERHELSLTAAAKLSLSADIAYRIGYLFDHPEQAGRLYHQLSALKGDCDLTFPISAHLSVFEWSYNIAEAKFARVRTEEASFLVISAFGLLALQLLESLPVRLDRIAIKIP